MNQLIKKIATFKYGHQIISLCPPWITGKLKEHTTKAQAHVLIPLFHKETPLGFICLGKRFMGEEYKETDIKILELIASHLTKALFNYELIQDVENKKNQLNLKLLELETLFLLQVDLHIYR